MYENFIFTSTGNYPKSFDGEMTIMKACMVGTTSSCIKSWNVTVKYCSGHIVAYLKPLDTCARYCKGKHGIGKI